MGTFSFSPPINLIEKNNWLLATTSLEANNSVLNVTHENKRFSIGIPGRWRNSNYLPEGYFDELRDFLELCSRNENELHVDEVRKSANQRKTGDNENILTDFETFEKKYLKN